MSAADNPTMRLQLVVLLSLACVVVYICLPSIYFQLGGGGCGLRSKDASLKSDLRIYRNAVKLFRKDTGQYPHSLDELVAPTGPKNYHGPYVDCPMLDPVSRQPFVYDPVSHHVASSAQGDDPDCAPYAAW
jgi:hypothetical protein